jgi:hypothetical protein
MDADAHMETVRSVRDLEEAVAIIFQNNFDEDSKVCIVTIMKLLDNLLHQPGNPKVRTIRLGNKAFSNRVGSRVGAIDFLQACGFQYENEQELELVLLPEEEHTKHLINARRLLMTRAITDLGMSSDALPPYRPPPTLTSSTSSTTNATTGRSNADTATPAAAFNPYQGHRHDAKSAAVGANLGPDSNYVSATESQLQSLQRQQATLEAKLQQPLQDRAWIATLPVSALPATAAVSTVTASTSSLPQQPQGGNSTTKAPSDGALLAQRAKRQHEERMQRENGGMTTKAMRDLEKIKKQKVYTHCSLTIQFSDGCKLTGKFLPKETIATVIAAVNKCLLGQQSRNFDLYVTPPRRLLPPKSTLTQEGLVPAAKIFVSWKDGSSPDKNSAVGSYLEPRLFGGEAATSTSSFPSAQPIVGSDRASSSNSNSQDGEGGGKTEKKTSREEDLLKRMMGGKSGGLGGGSAAKKPASKDPKDAKPPGAGGKPKWFK